MSSPDVSSPDVSSPDVSSPDVSDATVDPPQAPADPEEPRPATWPERERFAETAAALHRPWALVTFRVGADGPEELALARRDAQGEGGGWTLVRLMSGDRESVPGCDSLPCPWPASLVPSRPLEEPPALPEHLRTAVAYARTLLAFEGPLSIHEGRGEDSFPEGIPEELWADGPNGQQPNLVPYLERLRRYHPMGYCSMDSRPQQAAMLRARAAAQAGRTGWAVQGWISTVGYWSSPRLAASTYGQSHPEDHLELLERVGVTPDRFLLGLLIDLPGLEPELHLADVRRVVPDLGPSFAADLRALAADPAVDPFNRAILFAAVAQLPFTADPLYRQLPAESRALLDLWSR